MNWVGGTWWELQLASGWVAKDDPECLSITRSEAGAFQLSAAVKSAGPITIEELSEYYESRIPKGSKLKETTLGAFQGLATSYAENGSFWYKAWVASGSLLVFATYNGTESAWELEQKEVFEMLRTLRLRDAQNTLPT